jgi:hypothetical protein
MFHKRMLSLALPMSSIFLVNLSYYPDITQMVSSFTQEQAG